MRMQHVEMRVALWFVVVAGPSFSWSRAHGKPARWPLSWKCCVRGLTGLRDSACMHEATFHVR